MSDQKGVTVRFDPELWRRLKLYTIDTGDSIQQLTIQLITEYLDRQPVATAKKQPKK